MYLSQFAPDLLKIEVVDGGNFSSHWVNWRSCKSVIWCT